MEQVLSFQSTQCNSLVTQAPVPLYLPPLWEKGLQRSLAPLEQFHSFHESVGTDVLHLLAQASELALY